MLLTCSINARAPRVSKHKLSSLPRLLLTLNRPCSLFGQIIYRTTAFLRLHLAREAAGVFRHTPFKSTLEGLFQTSKGVSTISLLSQTDSSEGASGVICVFEQSCQVKLRQSFEKLLCHDYERKNRSKIGTLFSTGGHCVQGVRTVY